MSRADFAPRAVDLDLLADYAAGVLDRPQSAEVAHLISTEPAWAWARAALVRADAAVQGDLRAYAQSRPEPMPADVVARIEDALSAAAGPGNVVPITAARGRARHASGRHRRFATGLAAAAAAAVALIGGLAVAQNFNSTVSGGSQTPALGSGAERGDAAAGGADAPTAPPQAPSGVGPVVFSTGTDYGLDSLAQFSFAIPRLAPPPTFGATKSAVEAPVPDQAVRELQRLNDQAALQNCLAAITAQHPGRAVAVDYARFEGAPALVVLVLPLSPELAAGGAPVPGTVVVVGRDCGVSSADVKAVVPTS